MTLIAIMVPDELAKELVDQSAARIRPRPRGTIIDLVIVGSSIATTCITLVSGPETLVRFAHALKKICLRNKQKQIEVHVKGISGEIDFRCDTDAPIEELLALVKRVIGE